MIRARSTIDRDTTGQDIMNSSQLIAAQWSVANAFLDCLEESRPFSNID